MKKFTNKKGFTIMEMLIVVAIIAVLVAIAIPTFSGSLVKAKEAADVANIRAAYAEAQVQLLEGTTTGVEELLAKALDGKSTTWDAAETVLNYPDKASFTAATTTDAAKIEYGQCEKLKTASNGDTYTWEIGEKTV